MKKLVAVLVMAGVLAGGTALAADKLAIGIVDVSKVMRESKLGKRGEEELRKLAESRREKLKAEGQKFEKLREDAQKNEALMTDKQKEEKGKELQTKYEALRKMEAEAKEEISKRDSELGNTLVQEIRAVVADLAKEQGLVTVLNAGPQGVLYAVDGVNLTAKVVERLDAKTK
jgi:outer membrane protein